MSKACFRNETACLAKNAAGLPVENLIRSGHDSILAVGTPAPVASLLFCNNGRNLWP